MRKDNSGQFCKNQQAAYFDLEDLRLDKLWVVYPGQSCYPLKDDIEILPLDQMKKAVAEIQRH